MVIVNQAFADRFWPGESALGKTVDAAGTLHRVVGVAKNGRYFTLGEAVPPFMYLSQDQIHRGGVVLHVRTRSDPRCLIPVVRREVAALDDQLPLSGLKTMESHLDFATMPVRLMASVVGAFAAIALLLAAVGLYGVLALFVNQAVRELSIRMAIGAGRFDIVLQVVRRGIAMAALGLAVGLVASVGIGGLISGLVFGVSPADPLTYHAAVVVLLITSITAAILPAWRASRLDPIRGLSVG